MFQNRYENHLHKDPNFPLLFHLDYVEKGKNIWSHWHESIEILLVTEGIISVSADHHRIVAHKNEMVLINSGYMHTISTSCDKAKYYCLIIDKNLCDEVGIPVEDTVFQDKITDPFMVAIYSRIKDELEKKEEFYHQAVKSAAIDLLIQIYRNYVSVKSSGQEKPEELKTEVIKKSIKFMQEHYHENISTSDIAKEIGLSTSYFCRTFKEVTSCTPIGYMNHLRCYNAKKYFQLGKYTVSEVATLCGFDNLSYFSKTYKKYMGKLPSLSRKTG